MGAFGYMGKILYVDLHSGELAIEELDPKDAYSSLGGMGVNTKLMEKNYAPGTEPLSPENPVIIGSGPFVGTGVQGASKTVATTRFPLNGTISESVGSMRFATTMKGAGFDHIVITGRSKKPVVLALENESAHLIDAGDLWGLDTIETTDQLKAKYGGKAGVIAIGPAGENNIPFALALMDKASTLGRGGLGAVLGSKKMKAIAAVGNRRPKIHSPDEHKRLVSTMRERLKRFKEHKRILELGFMEGWDTLVRKLSFCNNFSQVFPFDKANDLYGLDVYKSFKANRFGCPSCVTPDKESLEIVDGPFKGFKTTTTSYINSYLFGQLFDLNKPDDITASVRFLDQLDRMGVDMFTFGHMLDFLITEHETGNLDSTRFRIPLVKSFEALSEWLNAIVYRKQSAEMFLSGWKSLLVYVGKRCSLQAPLIKNCEVLYDPRLTGMGTMEFEQIVSPKGPRSNAGGSPTFIIGLTEENLPIFSRHLDRMGASEDGIRRVIDSPLGLNIGRMTRYSEDWYTILNSMGICNRHFNNRFYSLDLCCQLFNAITGFEVDMIHFRKAASEIWTRIRILNQNEGFAHSDDRPPDIWFSPMLDARGNSYVMTDYFGKEELTRDDISNWVKDYYDERGWPDGLAIMPEES